MKQKLYILIFLLLAYSLSAQVARQKVLVEVFTGVNCPYCPAAANGIKDMLNAGLQIAPVAIHTSAFSIPQFYTPETNARAQYYGISSYPTAKFDGILTHVGGGGASSSNYAAYVQRYNQRINVPSDFTINLSLVHLGGNDYRADVTLQKVGPGTYSNLVFQLFLTESNIQWNWMGMTELNWVTRDIIPTQNGTPVDFTNASTVSLKLNFTMNPAWVKNNCTLVGFIQNNTTKEVLQANLLSMNIPLYNLDAELFKVMNLQDQLCSGTLEPEVVIKNNGVQTLTSLKINFQINGQIVYTYHWLGSLSYSQTALVQIPAFTFDMQSTNQVIVSLSEPNNSPDQNPGNDTYTASITYPETVTDYLLLIMNTDANPQQTTWSVYDPNGNVLKSGGPYTNAFQLIRDTIYFNGSTGCHRFTIYDSGGNGLTTYYLLRSFVNGVITTIGSGATFAYKESTEFNVESGVGILSPDQPATAISVFPNPASRSAWLTVNLKETGTLGINLYNLTGQKVWQKDFSQLHSGSHQLLMELPELPDGVYYLYINGPDLNHSQKLVISH